MPNHALKTPLLVPLPATFDEYLRITTKRGRYEFKHAPKIEVVEVGFDIDQVDYWMRLWETQPIKGGFPKFRKYTPAKCQQLHNKGILHVFTALGAGCSEVGLQMLEICGDYAYCHPPLYDKSNQIAKSMWFGLIKWSCGKFRWLDLGGGQQRRWDELKRNANYKWLYVPKNIETQPWKVQICRCGWRELICAPKPCSRCASGR